jgi:8-oxo-dGTP pyrophosphatase MutT (NUDIX family)
VRESSAFRRRASAVIIKDDQILMVRISDQGKSWWCLPGGTIEPDETPEQAIRREMYEELELKVKPRQRLYKSSMPYERGVDYGILVDLPSHMPSLGVDRAVVEWAWCPLDEVDDSWQIDQVRKALAGEVALSDSQIKK